MDLDLEKNEKYLKLVQKHQGRFDEMNYEFYDLDTPSLDGKIESTLFVFEVLEIYHLLDSDTKISDVSEYHPGLFKEGIIDGFTFYRNGSPYCISLLGEEVINGYHVIPFGKSRDLEIQKKENELIEIFELFQKGESLRKFYHWDIS